MNYHLQYLKYRQYYWTLKQQSGGKINRIIPDVELTYGELTEDGFTTIIKNIDNRGTFYDIGCGEGKVILWAHKNGFKRVKGVEYVKERYDKCLELLKGVHNAEIIHGDMFNLKLSDANVIYMSNLCFGDDTNKRLAKKIYDECNDDVIIFCSVSLDDKYFENVKDIIVKMTWNEAHTEHMMKKRTVVQ